MFLFLFTANTMPIWIINRVGEKCCLQRHLYIVDLASDESVSLFFSQSMFLLCLCWIYVPPFNLRCKSQQHTGLDWLSLYPFAGSGGNKPKAFMLLKPGPPSQWHVLITSLLPRVVTYRVIKYIMKNVPETCDSVIYVHTTQGQLSVCYSGKNKQMYDCPGNK